MVKLGEIMKSEINQTPQIFDKILKSNLVSGELENVLEKEQIKSILVLARGTSDNAAHFFKYLIETQLGIPCGLTSPSSVTMYQAKLHYQGTLVVAISQSGRSTDLLEFAKSAKSAGAKIVAITNDENSPLAQGADFHLSLLAGPEIAVAATKSYSAQLLISYLLVMKWARKEAYIQKLVKQAEAALDQYKHISSIVSHIDLDHEIVVLGRGFAYPNAKEAALKIQETCKVSVQGMSTADYLHGPISALNANSQVILIAPYKMPSNSITEALSKIRAITKNIYWIGQGEQSEISEFRLGGSICEDEVTSSIVDSIILQLFALNLAISNNYNPDAPVGLSKVTLTL